jgi:metal-responsive CopG/Arc/MetJ family transcriptional regulator
MCQNETGGTTISIYINTQLVDELDKLVDKNKDIYRSTLISEAVAFWLENKKRKTA